MASDIDRAGVAKAYGRWAPVYDLVFGKVFDHGRQSTIAEADRIGGRILDVGVGDRIVAVGLFAHHQIMRRRYFRADAAQGAEPVKTLGLSNVETLAVMDAKNLAFPDSFFRCGGGAICHHCGAGPRGHAG